MSVSGDGANSVITFEGTFKFTALDRNENWVGIIAQVKNAASCHQADDAHKWYVTTRLCLHPPFCPTTNTSPNPLLCSDQKRCQLTLDMQDDAPESNALLDFRPGRLDGQPDGALGIPIPPALRWNFTRQLGYPRPGANPS